MVLAFSLCVCLSVLATGCGRSILEPACWIEEGETVGLVGSDRLSSIRMQRISTGELVFVFGGRDAVVAVADPAKPGPPTIVAQAPGSEVGLSYRPRVVGDEAAIWVLTISGGRVWRADRRDGTFVRVDVPLGENQKVSGLAIADRGTVWLGLGRLDPNAEAEAAVVRVDRAGSVLETRPFPDHLVPIPRQPDIYRDGVLVVARDAKYNPGGPLALYRVGPERAVHLFDVGSTDALHRPGKSTDVIVQEGDDVFRLAGHNSRYAGEAERGEDPPLPISYGLFMERRVGGRLQSSWYHGWDPEEDSPFTPVFRVGGLAEVASGLALIASRGEDDSVDSDASIWVGGREYVVATFDKSGDLACMTSGPGGVADTAISGRSLDVLVGGERGFYWRRQVLRGH